MHTRVRNDLFVSTIGFTRGKNVLIFGLWQFAKFLFFRSVLPWPSFLRVLILRFFGAKIGSGVVIKPQVNIHLPWKLVIGDFTWIGEEAYILNFEPVRIGSHICISQRAFLCAGNHNYRDPSMGYRNAAIVIDDGVWVGAQVFVAPGVEIGCDAVLTAGSVVVSDVEAGKIYSGNPARVSGVRWPSI